MRLFVMLVGVLLLLITGCTAPVKLVGYPSSEAGNYSKEACKNDYENVRVLGSLPDEGTYVELGYMNVQQESGSELVYTSEEKQIQEARIRACQWGADAIVVMGSQSDKGSDFWTGWKDRRETKIIAIKYKKDSRATSVAKANKPQMESSAINVKPGKNESNIRQMEPSSEEVLKDGLKGFTWGTLVDQFRDTYDLKEISEVNNVITYGINLDSILDLQVDSITVNFYMNDFYKTTLWTTGFNNHIKLLDILDSTYGKGNKSSNDIKEYSWGDALSKTTVKYKYNVELEESELTMASVKYQYRVFRDKKEAEKSLE